MSQKKCFKVIKYPATVGLNCGKEVGSFENEDDAKRCKEKESSKIDNGNFIVEIRELKYEA